MAKLKDYPFTINDIKHKYLIIGMSARAIATHYKCSESVIERRLKRNNINIRNQIEAMNMPLCVNALRIKSIGNKRRQKYEITDNQLYNDYIIQLLSLSEISKKYCCSKSLVKYLLESYQIPIRSNIEANKLSARNKTISDKRKKWWEALDNDKRAEVVSNMVYATCIKPNSWELKVQAILEECASSMFVYTGNGKYFIGGKNPDFVDYRNRIIIELYGEHWHEGHNPEDRINTFKQYGYQTLVIWGKELKNESVLKTTIKTFISKVLDKPLET